MSVCADAVDGSTGRRGTRLDRSAAAPASRAGTTLPTFDSVYVYALLARVLGVKAAAGDGGLSEVAAALR